MAALEELAADADARQEQIVSVLVDAFEDLIEAYLDTIPELKRQHSVSYEVKRCAGSSRSSHPTRPTSTGTRCPGSRSCRRCCARSGRRRRRCCVSDAGSDQTLVDLQTEEAIASVIGDDAETFAGDLAELGAAYGQLARDDHRRFVDAFRNGAVPGVDGG